MNKETYEALKTILGLAESKIMSMEIEKKWVVDNDKKKAKVVRDWIDEVAKEYVEDITKK